MSHIISSRNLFIDSINEPTPDNFTLNLGQDTIRAGDGQALKLTLLQFNAYNNILSVNSRNNLVKIYMEAGPGGTSTSSDLYIPPNNYATLGEIAQEFATLVKNEALSYAQTQTNNSGLNVNIVDLEPVSGTTMFDTSDRVLSFQLNFSGSHGITHLDLRCEDVNGDSWMLLGGTKIEVSSIQVANRNSFDVTITNNTIKIDGRYRMQRSTDAQVYLRSSIPNSNIEMASLSSPAHAQSSTVNSNILGVFQLSHEFIHFDSLGSEEFTETLRSKELNSIKFFLTDRRNRSLGERISFSAVIRIEVVQLTIPRQLKVAPDPLPNLKLEGVMTHLKT